MIAEIDGYIKRRDGLVIQDVEVNDPTVVLIGEDWSLAIVCPWRLLLDGTEIAPWEARDSGNAFFTLIGHTIVTVSGSEDEAHPNAPIFEISGGYILEIEPDTDLDPWVLRTSGMTYVGSLGR